MRYVTSIIILASFSVWGLAGPREDAQAALAMARAKLTMNLVEYDMVTGHVSARDYATGRIMAIQEGKPLMVRVGKMDCSVCCAELIPTVIIAHTNEIFNDGRDRVILAVPNGNRLFFQREWYEIPPAAEVRAEIAKARGVTQAAPSLRFYTAPSLGGCAGGQCR